MSWEKKTRTKFTNQEVAEQVLQIYMKSLQELHSLESILSECCILDYFGKTFYGKEKVASHLISNLYGSSFELSSLSVNDKPSAIQWNLFSTPQEKQDDDLRVALISPPKYAFTRVTFSTPVRSFSQPRKRCASEASAGDYADCAAHHKMCKTERSTEQGSSTERTDEEQQNMLLSPQSIEAIFLKDLKYLTAYGTIRYPKRVFPTMDLKRIKHHSLVAHRGRFCQLYIGYECDENAISVINCKIWTIKYNFSSKVTPRNLLKAFLEVDLN